MASQCNYLKEDVNVRNLEDTQTVGVDDMRIKEIRILQRESDRLQSYICLTKQERAQLVRIEHRLLQESDRPTEQEGVEQERAEQEKVEQERAEQERAEHERVEQERAGQEKVKKERVEQERSEQEKVKKERAEQEKVEQERIEQEKVEQERAEQERVEQERLEQERVKKERVEQERVEQEKVKQERAGQEKVKKERIEQKKVQKKRAGQEKVKKERIEQDRAEQKRSEQERAENERVEQGRMGNKITMLQHPVIQWVLTILLLFCGLPYIAGSMQPDIEAFVSSTVTFNLPYQTSLQDAECFLNQIPLNIRNDEKYRMEMTGGKLRFTIQDISLHDAGIYRCTPASTQQDTGVHVIVTDFGFKWLPTVKMVSSNYEKDVKLKWRYEASKLPNKIIFIRYDKHGDRREIVGEWTKDRGFIMNRITISTRIDLNITTVNNGEELVLMLTKTYPKDCDLMYTCQIFYGNHIFFQENVELRAIKPEVTGTPEVGKGTPGQNVMFVWKYEYNYPIWRIVFLVDYPYKDELGYWYGGNYIVNEVDPANKERVVFNMTKNGTRWTIILTLLNTVESDYNRTYYCRVVGRDGYEGRGEINLHINDKPQETTELDRNQMEPAPPSAGNCITPLYVLIFLMAAVIYHSFVFRCVSFFVKSYHYYRV